MKCDLDGCEKEATHTFVWPWGTPAACCDQHVIIVQQRSKQARGRFGQVSFSRLDPDRPREITRDERIDLHSGRLVAEAERDDARTRATKLFDANTLLQNEVRQLRARGSQFEADIRQLRENNSVLVRERDEALIRLDKLRETAEALGVQLDGDRNTPPDPLMAHGSGPRLP